MKQMRRETPHTSCIQNLYSFSPMVCFLISPIRYSTAPQIIQTSSLTKKEKRGGKKKERSARNTKIRMFIFMFVFICVHEHLRRTVCNVVQEKLLAEGSADIITRFKGLVDDSLGMQEICAADGSRKKKEKRKEKEK